MFCWRQIRCMPSLWCKKELQMLIHTKDTKCRMIAGNVTRGDLATTCRKNAGGRGSRCSGGSFTAKKHHKDLANPVLQSCRKEYSTLVTFWMFKTVTVLSGYCEYRSQSTSKSQFRNATRLTVSSSYLSKTPSTFSLAQSDHLSWNQLLVIFHYYWS